MPIRGAKPGYATRQASFRLPTIADVMRIRCDMQFCAPQRHMRQGDSNRDSHTITVYCLVSDIDSRGRDGEKIQAANQIVIR
jgi:hypothetical protein